jgi:hypothetical protein
MPARANGLGKFTAKRKSRRASNLKKTRYQAPTARNQKRQILGNATAINRIYKMLPSPAYCDWQLGGAHYSGPPGLAINTAINSTELLDPQSWISVLRKDENVSESSTTQVKRMQMNIRYMLNDSRYSQMSLFIVTIRKNAANRLNLNVLTQGNDYISSVEQGWNVRLNPAVFKVHYARYCTLTNNALLLPVGVVAGTPTTTYKKGQVNISMNMKLREPNGFPWVQMQQFQLTPSNRYYLLTFQNTITRTGDPDLLPASINYDCLFTTYNVG